MPNKEGIRFNTSSNNTINKELLFKRYYNKDGLPNDCIRSIFQDRKGFLWVGTMNGLAKYDGNTFKNFYKTENDQLLDNSIYCITEDSEDNLWIGTTKGIHKLDIEKETFESFDDPLRSSDDIINSLQFDKYGTLWAGSQMGLIKYDTTTHSFKKLESYPFNTQIDRVIISHDDLIWIATSENIIHYNVVTQKYEIYPVNLKPNAYGKRIWAMIEDQYKNLYIATASNGLLLINYNHTLANYDVSRLKNIFKNHEDTFVTPEIFDIRISNLGDFWLATDQGLAKIENIETNEKKASFYINNPTSDKSISHNAVYSLFIDHGNVLWCGTESGLNRLNLGTIQFRYYTFNKKSSEDHIRSIYSPDGNMFWFGDASKGFNQYNLVSNKLLGFTVTSKESFINKSRSIYIDKANGNVWIGSLGGLILLPGGKVENSIQVLKEKAVFSLLKDKKGNLWVGANEGLFKINSRGKKIDFQSKESGRPILNGLVRSLYEDYKGNIWVGYQNSSLGMYNTQNGQYISIDKDDLGNRIVGSVINSITSYPNHILWVASESGLNKITLDTTSTSNTFQIKNYLESDGLPDKAIRGLIADGKGNLWMSTIVGLVKFNLFNETFQRYLSDISFSSRSYQKINEQNFLFGTSDGFVLFNPQEIRTTSPAPKLSITNFNLFNKEVPINGEVNGQVIFSKNISYVDEIKLNHKNNIFTIGFSAFHFASPNENSFVYKLEGFNENWIESNVTNNSATYTNLDAGDYTFYVKAANNLGVWNDQPVSLKIKILPAPWKTWWAYLIYLITIAVILFIIFRSFLLYVQQKQLLKLSKLEKNQLEKLNAVKESFFTDVSHEFKTPLSLILGSVEEILSNENSSSGFKDRVKGIYRNCKKLLFLIEELMMFQKMKYGVAHIELRSVEINSFIQSIAENFDPLLESKSIHLQFEACTEEKIVVIDPNKIEKVMNNLLSNAINFSNINGTIRIIIRNHINFGEDHLYNLSEYENWIQITVEDNGKGISSEKMKHLFEPYYSDSGKIGTGLGLPLAKEIVEQHLGRLLVESEPNVKTSFHVFLPIKEREFDETKPSEDYLSHYNLRAEEFEYSSFEDRLKGNRLIAKTSYRLLLVDDNPEMLDFLASLFLEEYYIILKNNGKEALAYLKDHKVDLIVSDVKMPLMSGIELCKALKENTETSHIPIILLTAKSTSKEILLGLNTGVNDYISKPFHPDILKVKIKALLAIERNRIEKFKKYGLVIPEDIAQNPQDEMFLKKVIEAIEENISNEDFRVEDLGDLLAMSRSNLFRKLKAIIGVTPIQLLYDMRLQYAMKLLLERKYTISEISFMAGFKRSSSMITAFKRKFGKSPQEYLNHILSEETPSPPPLSSVRAL